MLSYYSKAFQAMGSTCEIHLYAETPTHANVVISAVIEVVARLERRYSRYLPDNVLYQINQAAMTGECIKVDEETASLLDYAETCYRNSDGLFDISSGVLRTAWDFTRNRLPDAAEIERLLAKVGWQKLAWNRPLLEFNIPGMELDFGGIVKEYAADQSAVICINHGINNGLVNLGGDIRVFGPHPDRKPWRIGIRHPRDPHKLAGNIELLQGGISSSGDYERCIKIADQYYSHILNPKSGWPTTGLASVTVIADFCLVAGSASTIAMLKGTQGEKWLRKNAIRAMCVDVYGTVSNFL